MIESKLPNVGTTIFSVMSNLAAEHKAVNLSQGFPDFSIDKRLKKYVIEALEKEQVQYAPMPGRLDLRQAIARKIKLQHKIEVNPESEITISAGATQAIYGIISAIVNKGDEVILFDPAYDCYDPTIRLNNGVPIHIELKHPTYNIDWEEVNLKTNDRTKLIIINNPHNPSGTTWDENDILELEKLTKLFPNLIILSDEVYEHIQFSDQHQSILRNEWLRKRSFVVYSFGKTLHVTGWKLGYCIAPELFSKELRKVHQYMIFCANNTIQYAVGKYLNEGENWNEIIPLFTVKRDRFIEKMTKSRFKVLPCNGTYFCLLDYSVISNESDVNFSKRITVEYGVATIPVSVFYEKNTDNKVIRICFAKEDETLDKAAALLCKI